MNLIFISAACVAVAGIAMLWLGLRGRRVGEHPYCRKCGFDLFGRPEGSTACAECGADLDARRAIVIGVRRRRRRLLGAGVAALVPALVVGGVVVWGQKTRVDWQKHKPDWWLAREADSPVAATRDAALGELIVRMQANGLSKSRVEQLVASGLRYQADPSKPWAMRWGDVVETARSANQVSDDDWTKYLEQGISDYRGFTFRKKLRRHDQLTFGMDIKGARLGMGGRFYGLHLAEMLRSVEIGGRKVAIERVLSVGPVTPAGWATGWSAPFQRRSTRFPPETLGDSGKDVLKDLQCGLQNGYVCIDASLSQRPPSRQRVTWPFLDDPLVTVHQRIPFVIEIVPDNQDILDPIIDESLRPKVTAAMRVSRLRISGAALTARFDLIGPVPVDLAYDVIAIVQGQECMLGMVALKRGEGQSTQPLSGPMPWRPNRTQVKTMDIIFRPEPAAATMRLDINSYWKHEIVIKDLEVDDLLFDSIADIERRRR